MAFTKEPGLFALVQVFAALNPDYRIYLRHHPYIPAWETNLYVIE